MVNVFMALGVPTAPIVTSPEPAVIVKVLVSLPLTAPLIVTEPSPVDVSIITLAPNTMEDGVTLAPTINEPLVTVIEPLSVRVLLKLMFVAEELVMTPMVRFPAPALVMHILGWLSEMAVRVVAFTRRFCPPALPMSLLVPADKVRVPAVIVSELLPYIWPPVDVMVVVALPELTTARVISPADLMFMGLLFELMVVPDVQVMLEGAVV